MIASHHTIIASLIANPESGGKYLGYLMSDDGLARIVLPLIITPIYNKNHGITFQIGALFFVVGIVVALLLHNQTKDIKVIKRIIKKQIWLIIFLLFILFYYFKTNQTYIK